VILYGRRSGARFTHRSLHVSRRRGTPTASTEATRPTGVELHEPGHRLRRGLLERRAAGLRQVDGMPREPACGLAEQSRSEPLASHRHALRRTSRYAQVNRHAKALGVSRRDPSSAFTPKCSRLAVRVRHRNPPCPVVDLISTNGLTEGTGWWAS